MARFMDFDAAEAEWKGDPITFRLGGRDWNASHVNAVNFLGFARRVAEEKGGPGDIAVFVDYILSTLADDEREGFLPMLAEADVQLRTVAELAKWITQQATGNPTSAASSLPLPQQPTGQRLKVHYSLDPVETSEDSASAAG